MRPIEKVVERQVSGARPRIHRLSWKHSKEASGCAEPRTVMVKEIPRVELGRPQGVCHCSEDLDFSEGSGNPGSFAQGRVGI